ncbi:MAG: hypothetical protein ACXVCY_13340 [Pseudobdellovibrionaceae bacterium]
MPAPKEESTSKKGTFGVVWKTDKKYRFIRNNDMNKIIAKLITASFTNTLVENRNENINRAGTEKSFD